MFSKMALYTSSFYTLSTSPKIRVFFNENETIEHNFGGCENVQNLLGQVNSSFGDKDINQTFLKKTLIFGDVDKV
jgi:hypothetical protein